MFYFICFKNVQEEIWCIWIEDVCYDVKNECESVNDSTICETYGAIINDKDFNVIECVWIEGIDNVNNITSDNKIESRCVLKVYINFINILFSLISFF
jgi:hypothetical protein